MEGENWKTHRIPTFGYNAHTSIVRRFRLILCWDVTDTSRHDGRVLREGLLDPTNTGCILVVPLHSADCSRRRRSRVCLALEQDQVASAPCPQEKREKEHDELEEPNQHISIRMDV